MLPLAEQLVHLVFTLPDQLLLQKYYRMVTDNSSVVEINIEIVNTYKVFVTPTKINHSCSGQTAF